jgi:hypothetical protein
VTPVVSRRRAAVSAAAATALGERALRIAVGENPSWQRANFRGREVLLSGGPAVAGGALFAAVLARAPGAVLAGGAAAILGLYDDLYGDTHARGLRGHLRALRQRRVTTGMVKLAGMATAGLAASRMAGERPVAAIGDAALIAGSANLANLLDLRPGRALKVVVVVSGVAAGCDGTAGAVAAGTAAAAAAALPSDLAEQVMIGDCGANALGALVGWTLATGLRPRARALAVAAVVGLTLASERISFTAVIERTPWLAAMDAWGRR